MWSRTVSSVDMCSHMLCGFNTIIVLPPFCPVMWFSIVSLCLIGSSFLEASTVYKRLAQSRIGTCMKTQLHYYLSTDWFSRNHSDIIFLCNSALGFEFAIIIHLLNVVMGPMDPLEAFSSLPIRHIHMDVEKVETAVPITKLTKHSTYLPSTAGCILHHNSGLCQSPSLTKEWNMDTEDSSTEMTSFRNTLPFFLLRIYSYFRSAYFIEVFNSFSHFLAVFTEKYCTANHVDKLPGPRDWVQILQDQIKLARRRLKRGSGMNQPQENNCRRSFVEFLNITLQSTILCSRALHCLLYF